MNDTCVMLWSTGSGRCGAPATHAVGKTCPSGHEKVNTYCDRCTVVAMSATVHCRRCRKDGFADVQASFSEPVRLRVNA